MLDQRQRRWPNINPALGQRLVFTERESCRLFEQPVDIPSRYRPSVGIMLGERRRRWASIKPAYNVSGWWRQSYNDVIYNGPNSDDYFIWVQVVSRCHDPQLNSKKIIYQRTKLSRLRQKTIMVIYLNKILPVLHLLYTFFVSAYTSTP